LEYLVRFNGDLTETFRALAGILIGDPASPMLWNLFLAGFELPPHPDDLFIHGVRVAHLELADDIAFICLSAPGMQQKLLHFESYCGSSFLHVNIPKTLGAVFGPLPDPLPVLVLYSQPLTWVPQATYVGTTFCS
ncbi:hypothetical protein OH77DRAFT_1383708, partial [Trametes cingulata]